MPGDAVDRLREHCEVTVWPEYDPPPREQLIAAAQKADALFTTITDRIDGEFLDAAPSIRIVANLAVGYDNIDVPACTQRGVAVTNTPGVLTETTAELTFALLLAYNRRIVEGERIVREGSWPQWNPLFHLGADLFGATLGIVGLGAIGLAVAKRARAFEMNVLYYSRQAKPEAERELGIERCELDELLRRSDYVSLNIALTPETRHIIGARELALMKPSAILVNTARGPVIDQAALVEALREKRIGGAALDVFVTEPIPMDDPLLGFDNVLVAPHIGSATINTRSRMAGLAVDNLLAFFAGRPLPTCVNPEVLTQP
jgi:glyoxylate reductase